MSMYHALIELFIESPGTEIDFLQDLENERQQILANEITYEDSGQRLNRLSDIKILRIFVSYLVGYRNVSQKFVICIAKLIYNDILTIMKKLNITTGNIGLNTVDEEDLQQIEYIMNIANTMGPKLNYIRQSVYIDTLEFSNIYGNIVEHYNRIKFSYENL